MDKYKLISELYDLYSRELLFYINSFVRNYDESEDILQNTYLRLISRMQKRPIATDNLRAFLYKIAKNLCLNHKKKTNNILQLSNDDVQDLHKSSYEILEEKEIKQIVSAVLAGLDPVIASVFYLRRDGSHSFMEIAAMHGISERTAKRYMEKAMRAIHDYMVQHQWDVFFSQAVTFLILTGLIAGIK